MEDPPQLIVLAGPNGAGKSTAAAYLLPRGMIFVNADEVAKTLPGYPAPAVDLLAARLVLEQMASLEQGRVSFALETTLASRSLAPRVNRLREIGYHLRLMFLFVPSADLSVRRVAFRVLRGGHSIPEATIRRRYRSGIKNFFELYRPVADKWTVYDTTVAGPPRMIAEGIMDGVIQIDEPDLWENLNERGRHGAQSDGQGDIRTMGRDG
jgi:predicted ABC-type ATPase